MEIRREIKHDRLLTQNCFELFAGRQISRSWKEASNAKKSTELLSIETKKTPLEELLEPIKTRDVVLKTTPHEKTSEEETNEWATEEFKRAKTILDVFFIKRRELDEKKDNSPILLIRKGSYVYETPFNHKKTRFHGHLEQDILVTRDKNDDKNLNLLYSFDSNNNQKFGGYYTRTFNFNGHFVLEKSIQNKGKPDHFGRPWAIDLNIVKDIDHLKALLK